MKFTPAVRILLGLILVLAMSSRAMAQIATPPSFSIDGPVVSDKCISCHAWRQPDLQPRTLKKPHDTLMFNHWPLPGPWCDRCHDPQAPRQLLLHHDQTVSVTETDQLCFQCHAVKVKDWRFGVHGKRVGSWQGQRRIQPCSVCHDPHQPAWKPMTPSTPPARPGMRQPWQPRIPRSSSMEAPS
ncbi:MAG: hypothetical protein HQL84_15395 [Magnetococcales bacterium]|nr:hypothetical protein [Magnetococcales bacterium]MBF0151405.1 hypothetical protein [Magnetococcales bacterium]MBF0348196.1 hypothetical protein [Magnetococcales bacterium]